MRFGFVRLANSSFESDISRSSLDSLILTRVANKDREALAEVYASVQRPLFRYLFHLLGRKELAEDVLQEVMVVVWQKAHTYHGSGSVVSWIFGVAHHQAFKALRRNSDARTLDLEAVGEFPDEALNPEADLLRRATSEAIGQALASLTPEHREVLELAFFQDFSGKEIAAIVGVPQGTVKSRLSYARRALKAALLRHGWEEE